MSEIQSLIAWAEKASDFCLLLFVFIIIVAFADLAIHLCFKNFSQTKVYRYVKYVIGIVILLSIFGAVIYSFLMI
ncbi:MULTISPECIES: hypothetical protein [Anoxybacillaceae]|jgi:hypothetical protein|uniref:Uncharacterized protein n=3 Tax=Anoxybacillaceae TaxID=3120669 RepID=A0A023DJA5_9BACL|nr:MULTISPECIES: hypothetical protein [Bacillaceae]ANB59053.1 putative membrane protein [Anoxybacillus sp. B2M1]ANB62463.1 putative membrane protein [Anoxybacillus sp. B7M1]MBB3854328.1 preprotein translocase subunit SecE [Parageobacillus caldoxylosilyticus]MBB3907336.1 preprotein translocase subunit SecE [Anoxybacillus rupiensis]MDE8565734.1 hypothetical protein [Anoxybacillus rupiensis]